jgi:DNA (cytosine-5)-methyltransferase 1
MGKFYLDLFSGIGGFALGAVWAGTEFDEHYYSEVDKYADKQYRARFPGAVPLGDVRGIDYAKLPEGDWYAMGGFPCQPHSVAGKKLASEDGRDLWPECRRMLRELRPRGAVFENVPGLVNSEGGRFFNRVMSEIYESGYDAEWQTISAYDAGAWHLRNRIWIVCYPSAGVFGPEAASHRNAHGGHEAKER